MLLTSVGYITIKDTDEETGVSFWRRLTLLDPLLDENGIPLRDGNEYVFPDYGPLRRRLLYSKLKEGVIDDVPTKLLVDIQESFKKDLEASPEVVRKIFFRFRPLVKGLLRDKFIKNNASARMIKLETLLRDYEDFRFVSKQIFKAFTSAISPAYDFVWKSEQDDEIRCFVCDYKREYMTDSNDWK
ncbi:hypothetical protein IKG02_00315 [Candidatus Saccharibacteria bacterium]|nr:hypothetical protein [Candidatus Saccharibacteria bacterium]